MKKILSTILLFYLYGIAYAQTTVSGKVSADGESLPGVNILVKGTTSGTISDIDGRYTLQIPAGSSSTILVFTFTGFKTQEVPVNGRNIIDVTMVEDVKALQEVVIVGYGEMKKSDLTSAHVSISSKEIDKTINTTLEQAIQGRAAGVYVTQNTGQPGGGISVNIRGVNSITGSNEPLYVIDGVQIAPGTVSWGSASSTNPLAGLNPSDVESMEILQGPSATAIYGSRGTNGVILITTKRGKSGDMKVNYGFLYSLQDRPKPIPVMNLREYAQMTNEIRALTGGNAPTEFQDPSILGEGTNWQMELFRTAPLKKHQLSLSGGSEKTTFYLSGEYFDQEGVAIGSRFDRGSLRLNVDNETRKWLKLGVNMAVNQTREDLATTQENVINNAIGLAPNIPVRNPDGTWGGADPFNGSSLQFTPLNPIAIASLTTNTLKRYGAIGGVNAEIKIIDGLVFRTNLSGNAEFREGTYFVPRWQLGGQFNEVARLQSTAGNNSYWNWNQLLQYNKELGKHSFGIMASHEAQASRWTNLFGERQGFVSNDIVDLNVGNPNGALNNGGKGHWGMESYFGRVNYSFDDKYIVQGAVRADGSSNFGPENRWGVFPSVSAAWRISEEQFFKNALPFINEFKLRVETGVTGNQGSGAGIFAPLSSVATPWGAGFIANRYSNPGLKWEETLTNNVGFNLNLFKNRIQLEADFYIKKTDNLLMLNPLPDYMGTAGEGSIGAPTVNIGALENRGYAITLNTVNIDNRNFTWNSNFNISGFDTKVTQFYSETAFINRTAWYMNNWTQRAQIGAAPWMFWGYIEEGLFKSIEEIEASAVPVGSDGNRLPTGPNSVYVGDVKYKDINGDGIIDERDQTFIGNPWPKFSFGITNTFSYKGFDLMVLITGSYGNDVYNYLKFVNSNPNNINLGRNLYQETFNYARIGENSEGQPYLTNEGTTVPRIVGVDVNGNGQRFTDKFVEDGSYLRIKNVQLGYNVPKSMLSKVGQNFIQGLRVAVGVQNLYTLTRYTGFDPEVGAYVGRDVTAAAQSIGLDFGRYPLTPLYTFSLGIDF